MSLFDDALSTPELAAVLGDACFVAAMLRCLGALARVQGSLGLIPAASAQSIGGSCKPELFDVPKLVRESQRTRCLARPVLDNLREAVAVFNPQAADHVALGVHAADLVGSAMALIGRDALERIDGEIWHAAQALTHLAQAHLDTPLLCRSPGAAPQATTLGCICLDWLAPLLRARHRLQRAAQQALCVWLAEDATGVPAALARELQLPVAAADATPQGDVLLVLASELSLLAPAWGRIAADLERLAQSAAAEIDLDPVRMERSSGNAAPGPDGWTACALARAVALAAPQRLAALSGAWALGRMREGAASALGWRPWIALLGSVHAAAQAMAAVLSRLQPQPARMSENLLTAWPAAQAALRDQQLQQSRDLARRQLALCQASLAAQPPRSAASAPDPDAPLLALA